MAETANPELQKLAAKVEEIARKVDAIYAAIEKANKVNAMRAMTPMYGPQEKTR